MNAIEVQNLSKVYHLYNSSRDRLREFLSPTRRKYHHAFHAVKDVSFNVEKGQSLGPEIQCGPGNQTQPWPQ